MIFTKILSVIILNAKITATQMGNCTLSCDEDDRKAVCAFDKDEVCFRLWPSKCELDLLSCIFQFNYTVYLDDFCTIDAFKCTDKLFVQSPPADKTNSAEDFENSLKSADSY